MKKFKINNVSIAMCSTDEIKELETELGFPDYSEYRCTKTGEKELHNIVYKRKQQVEFYFNQSFDNTEKELEFLIRGILSSNTGASEEYRNILRKTKDLLFELGIQ